MKHKNFLEKFYQNHGIHMEHKKDKLGWAFLILAVLVLTNFIFAQGLSDYASPEKISFFMTKLSESERIKLIESSDNQAVSAFFRKLVNSEEELSSLSAKERNLLFQKSQSYFDKRSFITKLLADSFDKKFGPEMSAAVEKQIIDTWLSELIKPNIIESLTPLIREKLKKDEKIDITGLKIDVKDMNVKGLKAFIKDYLKIDLNIVLPTKVERVIGFGDLKWSDKGKNIIGDGKTWIDLENLPNGVSEIEYKNAKFILRLKNKGEIVIEEGSVDEKGVPLFFNNFEINGRKIEKFADLSFFPENGQIILTGDGFKLNGNSKVTVFDMVFSADEKEGSVRFGENRVVVKGIEFEKTGYVKAHASEKETVIYFGGAKIESPEGGESTVIVPFSKVREAIFKDQEAISVYKGVGYMGAGGYSEKVAKSLGLIYFQFDENGKLTGVAKKGINDYNYVSVRGSLGEGDLKEIYDASSPAIQALISKANGGESLNYKKIKTTIESDADLSMNGNKIYIEKYDKVKTSDEPVMKVDIRSASLDGLAKEVSFTDVSGSWVYMRFNEQGRLTDVAKNKVNSGDWVSISGGSLETGDLSKIHGSSGETIMKLIEEAKNGNKISFVELSKRFYSDSELKREANQINIDSYQDNFIAIIGENYVVGGSGSVELLRDTPSITGINAENFRFKAGEIEFKIDEKGLNVNRAKTSGASFAIGDIAGVVDGKLLFEGAAIIPNKNGENFRIVDESGTEVFVAGREVILGPYGSSVDIHVDIDRESLQRIKDSVRETDWEFTLDTPKDLMINQMMKEKFSLNVDLYTPVRGINVNVGNAREIARKQISSYLGNFLDSTIISGTEQIDLRENMLKKVESLVVGTINSVDNIGGGRTSIEIKNNGAGSNPSLIFHYGSQAKTVSLSNEEAGLLSDALQAGLRAPILERGDVPFSYFGAQDPSQYWPRSYLERLWYQTLGRGSSRFDRMLFQRDAEFFKKGESSLKERYTY